MKNCICVVGFGAGNEGGMTIEALKVLKEAELIVGYTVYCELLRPLFSEKEFFSSPMTKEVERCRVAIEEAKKGKRVAVICSGDSGVYGLAALLIEMTETEPVDIRVIPGVTAALSGAALLGAPLGGDFVTISMSDLMTPFELIEKRLMAAAKTELPIVLYNPSSKKRADYLRRACDIVLRVRDEKIVCGVAKNIGRKDESSQLLTLGELRNYCADMFTTVFIGNSTSRVIRGKMVTPRGYRIKEGI